MQNTNFTSGRKAQNNRWFQRPPTDKEMIRRADRTRCQPNPSRQLCVSLFPIYLIVCIYSVHVCLFVRIWAFVYVWVTLMFKLMNSTALRKGKICRFIYVTYPINPILLILSY
jgi:hypothetical protein